MAKGNIQAWQPKHIVGAGSTLVAASDGILGGIFLSSGTGITATIYDGQNANGAVIVNGVTLVAGWNPMGPFGFANGLFVVLAGTSPDVTVGYLS